MGIRFEKDSLMNWMNEIGKYLRLIKDKFTAFDEPEDPDFFDNGYSTFFGKDRVFFLNQTAESLQAYFQQELEVEQLRPLALILMNDGLHTADIEQQKNLLTKAKQILNYVMSQTSSFAFEDYSYLSTIDSKLR
ncbi:hypothetical protein [Sphingobacterium spiritivorum]|uniref:hypothetical protein n=1 Tax=Sphingobacterium spiritivorum TaxID=258 RepID=UPI001917EDDC|nr:hypothetical protein [Sphingobacterium spiritivorum]QQT27216.1 hypothetical protein I6J02_04970 [Sphingobacterium spiritivorum]